LQNSMPSRRYLLRTTVLEAIKRALHYVGSILEERLAQEKFHGADWAERPVGLKV
jgi:hypothetical protein